MTLCLTRRVNFRVLILATEPARMWPAVFRPFCLAGLLALSTGLTLHPARAAAATETATNLASLLAQPPAASRILKIIHNWPDLPVGQDQLIRRLSTQGFGGVVCNVSFQGYLENEDKWQSFTRAVTAAKAAGMALWLYDERGYPSGNAGGITLRGHPEWEARGLLVSHTESTGGQVTLALPPGRLVLAAAYPVGEGGLELDHKNDLAPKATGGQIQWQAPPGRWRVMAVTEDRLYEGTHADGNLHAKMPYVNLLQAEPTRRFLEVTHQAYAQRLGDDLGRYFMSTFTDEPSLMSLFLKPMPYYPLPWSSDLLGEFKRRRGYALELDKIPALVAEAGPGTARQRYDYWLTIGELVSENFFGQIQGWCRQHTIPSGGHLLAEEGLVGHVPLYGDFFRCIRRLDAPSIDCLTSLPPEVPWYIARLLASAAELEGHTLVMCETSDHSQVWRPAGDGRPKRIVTEAEIRGTCNRLMVGGVNCITSYYSFADLADAQLRRLNEWVGRGCFLLRGGSQVADIALLYPVESLWTRFTPSRHWTREAPAAARVESLYRAATDGLFTAPRDFTIVDSRALTEAKVEGDALVHGPLRWHAVVLPGVDTLPLAAWENLARFVRSGGLVVALGALPANSEIEFPSARVGALAREIFGATGREPGSHANAAGGAGIYLPYGSEALLALALEGALEPDLAVGQARSPLRFTHRRIDDRDLYYLINDSAQPWSGTVSFPAAKAGERWDLATGQAADPVTAGPVKVNFEPYGATAFRFAEVRPPRRRAIASGPLPNLALNSLPEPKPTTPHGEFVRAALQADAAHSKPDAPVWEVAATLTKGQVDTHLFAQFRYPQPADLSHADCLVVETWVPEGQRTPNELLVILHEDGGGDFVAHTGRSLAAPGRERSFLPLGRFYLAGWSKDADGTLDLKRVSEIRVGWGGYYGQEGETVVFGLSGLRMGSVGARPK
jgi:hypothetical protein